MTQAPMSSPRVNSGPHLDPTRRHDAVLFFDVVNGNPNGDPDAGNQPRVNPLDMHGLVSDVALKRKIRNWVSAARPADSASDEAAADNARYKVYVEEGVALNGRHRRAYTALGLLASKRASAEAQAWMCANFFDVRLFGAVMSTGDHNAGQLKGPVQVGIAESIDPIFPLDLAITRMAATTEKELEALMKGEKEGRDRTMGRKSIVPYALYRAHVYYSPHFGQRTGVDEADLDLFWRALLMMWDLDRSAARADMACRGLFVFTHTNPLGDAPAHKLTELISATKGGGEALPTCFADYTIASPSPADVAEGFPGVTFSDDLA